MVGSHASVQSLGRPAGNRHQAISRSRCDMLQELARRLITFGLHVHVGVDSGDKAVMICDRIMQHLPTLLALVGKQSLLGESRHRVAFASIEDHGGTCRRPDCQR